MSSNNHAQQGKGDGEKLPNEISDHKAGQFIVQERGLERQQQTNIWIERERLRKDRNTLRQFENEKQRRKEGN